MAGGPAKNESNPGESDRSLVVAPGVRIPRDEFDVTFTRSSGPGGQNVNKVSSKACLRWTVMQSPSISDAVKNRFVAKYRSRITEAGELLVTSQRTRDQGRNLADCYDKLREMIASVLKPPKARKRTKPTRAARERRLKAKRARAERKQQRRRPAN